MTTLAARVPIATFQDILDAMAQNPELEAQMRRHLQDEDFRNLPQAVARLAAGLEELAGIVRAMAEREERRDADIAELKEEQARQGAEQARQGADIAELKEGQARQGSDIAELKEGQARHTYDIDELKAGQARLEAGQEELKDGLTRVQGGLNRLAGTEYERNIARRLRRRAERHFGIRRAELIHSVILPNNNALPDLLDDAFTQGLISQEEADSAENIDMVIEGEDRAGAACYAVIEASVTVDRNDVDRALSRSRIIAQATAAGVVPAVVGVNIPDQVHSYADGLQVAAIVVPD